MDIQETDHIEFDFENAEARIFRESRDELGLSLGEFAGPVDLLLYLIRREQANIFDIPIAKITDEYLRYIRIMESLDIALAGEFLVMASTLIEIKTKMLLPQEIPAPGEEEPEDPRKELVDRLLEHQKFKNAAELLWSKATVEQAVFTRGAMESDDNNVEINASVFDLFERFCGIVERHKEEIQIEIERDELSLVEMLTDLKERLAAEGSLDLAKFFGELGSKHNLILAFISVLELVRTGSAFLTQKKTFGDIFLRAG